MATITLYELGSYNAGTLIPQTFDLDLISDEAEWRAAVSEWLDSLNQSRIEALFEAGKAPAEAAEDTDQRNRILAAAGELAEEWIVADYDEIPRAFVGEWDISPEYWDFKKAVENSYLDQDVFEAGVALGIPVDRIEEAYAGSFNSNEDFAENLAEEIGAINQDAAWPHSYIDWERAARDLMMDYNEEGGHYFRNDW